MMSAGSFLPLFLSLMDLPMLVVALEKVERSSGTLIGSSIATIQKSAAPEMLLALMDEAYTGSAVEEPSGNSGSDDSGPLDLTDPMFLDLLKDENDGIAAKHWISPTISSTLQAAFNSPQSDRLKQSLEMAPRFLTLYFATALRDVNDCSTAVCSYSSSYVKICCNVPRQSFLFQGEGKAFRLHFGCIPAVSQHHCSTEETYY
ncbi:hypothetical protein ZEAMMB73_Zm00001d002235 [Zea mays]|nr:hypothetical protein ZEAMMB73_Zm00001d002235 [Zea mays]